MTSRDTEVQRWVADLVEGREVVVAIQHLATGGAAGVRAILAARERPWPGHRHRNDWDSDLTDALAAIARVDPAPLLDALEDRAHAGSLVWALGQSAHAAATEALIRLAGDRDRDLRWSAVQGLSGRSGPMVVEALLARLRDRSAQVRFAALQALATRVDERVAPAFEDYARRYRALLPGERVLIEETLARHGRG